MKKTRYISPVTGEALYEVVAESKLYNKSCTENYDILKGVPYFATAGSFGERETQRVFGAEWTTFTEYDADNLEKMSYGMDGFFANLTVLEIGCGAGRHSRRLIKKFQAKSVDAIDLSDAVLVAAEKNKKIENIRTINANVFNLPFSDCTFDVGFSLGVLMHTEDPEQAFQEMCKKVKVGGKVVIWVYAKTPRKYFMNIFRFFTKNSPTFVQKFFAITLSVLLWPLVLLSRNFDINLSNHFKEYSKYDFYIYKTDMYDRIAAPLIAFYSEEDIRDWFETVGFDHVDVSTYGDFFVRGIGFGKKN